MKRITVRAVLLTLALSILGVVVAVGIFAFQLVTPGGTKEIDQQTTSGLSGTLTFPDQIGTQTNQFEMIVSGGPATNSVTINGCMRGNTCTTLTTSSSTANAVLSVSGGPYDKYTVAWTLTGGASPTLTFNRTGTSTRNVLGQVVGNIARLVNAVFGTNWVEASVQAGGDIETQIANACTALSALGNGGGYITVSWTGTKTGALGSNPFATCPDNAAPGNGVVVFFISSPNGTIKTSFPWQTPNKSRLYGAFGWLSRSWTTIQAGSAFKTIANARLVTLAQTTGLSRAAGGTVTATFANTAGAFGQAAVVQDVIQVGCATAGDQSFVGTWNVVSASATQITYAQPQLGAATNSNGTCKLAAGTPILDLCANGTTYGVTTTGKFGCGVRGLTIDADDLAGSTGIIGIRNIYSQEKTLVDDGNIINWNFIAMVLDNMQSSGLQNSGPYSNIEFYMNPSNDAHGNNCNPLNLAGQPFPAEAIYAFGLSIRGIYGLTATSTNCSDTAAPLIAFEQSNTGNVEWGEGGTVHHEGFNIGLAIGTQQANTGGVVITGYGGPPSDVRLSGTASVVLISANYATTDVAVHSVRRNSGAASAVVNQIDGDNLNCAGDSAVALYAWDKAGAIGDTVSTTSQCAPNRIVALGVNRLFTLGNGLPTLTSCTGLDTGSCSLISGSTDSSGTIRLAPTGAPLATGIITFTFTAALGTHIPTCMLFPSNQGTGSWTAPFSFIGNGADSTNTCHWKWTNTGALTAGSTYDLAYNIIGK